MARSGCRAAALVVQGLQHGSAEHSPEFKQPSFPGTHHRSFCKTYSCGGISLQDTAAAATEAAIGAHAVAITGFKLGNKPATPIARASMRLRAARIEKIYVHDDQVGPFARMVFDGVEVEADLQDGTHRRKFRTLTTSWRNAESEIDKVRAIPLILLVPLYHKIRIPYEDVIEVVTDFHEFLAKVPPLNEIAGAADFEWDIYLTTVNDLKADFQACEALKGQARLRWLTRPMPRFMWRATALSGARCILDLFFDATVIHTSNGVYAVLCYEEELAKALPAIAFSKDIGRVLSSLPGALRILSWFPANLDLVA